MPPVEETPQLGREQQNPADGTNDAPSVSPWNIMVKHRQVMRRGRRSQMGISFTDPGVSMDLLRVVLQPYISADIKAVMDKYMPLLQKASQNVRENVGNEVDAERLVREIGCSAIEHAKEMYQEPSKNSTAQVKASNKRFKPVNNDNSPLFSPNPAPKARRKRRQPTQVLPSDRKVPYTSVSKPKSSDPVKREGPKWDPVRLVESITFVLGSRANKALGMGGTRGRLYVKHPNIFKYPADSQDKHWLADQHYMPATSGKMAYLLAEADIRELSESDDYRDSADLQMHEIRPFCVPTWMLDKMKVAMAAARTDRP
uniref:deoxynucleotidyltransferase terminal-interacting protein 1 n=1 Tax=Myxine glutinosa TaxID=7769 RepID=UPI00358E9AF1